ncbi:hypothetical protein OE88DRAFT_221586 [Heliocybe sulcata]|uniref:Uncharacterized protein n=1 Tax=Heliocybe sulcata TaxID=5364 RepID=A0A5C3N0G2_9AGAM|nr:hypothetical protein OE88DRAFT_221586 [Heliocybe sulcata]
MSSHSRPDFWTNSVEPEAGECGSIGPPSAIPVSLSDSESTVSNRPGLGFTLDKSLTKAADKVVRILTRMSEGLGRGPNALMGRMLISGEWGAYPCHSRYCRVHQDSLGPSILWSSPSVDNVLDILFSPYCPQCRERYVKSLTRSEVFLDGCRKLVEGVREPNPSARRLHAYYISALSYFHSSFRCRFLELGADNALRDLRNEGKLWPRDFLVGPATRALFSLTETVIMPVVRVFDEQKRKVDAYFPRPLPEHDLSAIEAQTCDFVSTLLQALASPSLQVLAAYHLSLALVLSYHGLTQMVAPLSRALNAEVVDWLWGQLLRSEDPVARGALGRLLCNLYDFLSYAAFTSKWSADIGVSAGIWLWRTLWVPFFDLRSDLVSVVAIRKHVVCRVCKVFFRWSRTASSICYEAQADIQELLVKYEPSTLTRKRRRLSQDQESPITVLIQKIASPLFRLAASLEKERRISQSPHLHEIDRAIPRLLLSEVVGNIADVAINNSATLDAAVSISPVLKCAVPWHDSVCRYETMLAQH